MKKINNYQETTIKKFRTEKGMTIQDVLKCKKDAKKSFIVLCDAKGREFSMDEKKWKRWENKQYITIYMLERAGIMLSVPDSILLTAELKRLNIPLLTQNIATAKSVKKPRKDTLFETIGRLLLNKLCYKYGSALKAGKALGVSHQTILRLPTANNNNIVKLNKYCKDAGIDCGEFWSEVLTLL